MPSLNTIFELLLLWGAVASCAGIVYLAMRARRIEREQGLFRAKHRLTASVAILALVTLFALYGTYAAFSGVPTPAKPGQIATDPKTESPTLPSSEEIQRLEKERKDLEEKLAELRKRIDAARKPSTADAKEGAAAEKPAVDAPIAFPFEIPTAVLVLAVVMVVVGVLLLFLLGDPEVLVRLLFFGRLRDKGELRLRALANLDRLTIAADRGEYREGLAHADATDAHLLERFERMDWLFLRAYCAVQLGMAAATPDAEGRTLLESAVRGLTTLLEEAPNRAEASYLLATAHAMLGQFEPALQEFTRAEKDVAKPELPFAHNKSVCLLRLAESKLGQGNTEESGRLFDQVTRLKVMADKIPTTLVRVRLLNVRRNLQANQLGEAAEGIDLVRNLEGLDVEQRQNVEVVCDALQALVSIRRGDDALVLKQVDAFLTRHLPSGLPTPDEEIADEYLEAPITGVDLRIAPQVFSAFLFLKAAVLARSAAKIGVLPGTVQAAEIARPLLTALQFELRQRDVLAAVGGVYYLSIPEKRRKAVQWLEAAVSMGVESRVARRLLDRDKRIEAENKEALEWFRSAAGRFLHDPTVSQHVREALVEELGRFQGFQPLLLDLDRGHELDPQEPTLRLLRERAGFMQQMVTDFATRKPEAVKNEFDQLRQEYARLIATFDTSSGRMAEIERRLVQEIGKTVLS